MVSQLLVAEILLLPYREKNLKLMDAMLWHHAVSSQFEFFITNNMAFKSMDPVEVVRFSEIA